MTAFRRVLRLHRVPARYAAVYRARGMQVPAAVSGHSAGALIPVRWRWLHRWWTSAFGFFWLPCVLCRREFGGHEIVGSVPDPVGGASVWIMVCPFCTRDRNRLM